MIKKSEENQHASAGVSPLEQATEMALEPSASTGHLPSLAQALLCFTGIITAIAGGLFGLGISLHALMFLCLVWTSLHAFSVASNLLVLPLQDLGRKNVFPSGRLRRSVVNQRRYSHHIFQDLLRLHRSHLLLRLVPFSLAVQPGRPQHRFR